MARKHAMSSGRLATAATVTHKLLSIDVPNWKTIVQRSAATLSADGNEAYRRARTLTREARKIHRQALAPIIALLRRDPRSQRAREDALTRVERRRHTRLAAPRSPRRALPRITAGSIQHVFGPPYDGVWTHSMPDETAGNPAADAIHGTFDVWGEGHGRHIFGGAGVGIGFRAVSDMPMAHVRPLFRYNFDWDDVSCLDTAHNRALLKIRAIQFGPSGQPTKWPPDEVAHWLWADGTSWFEHHSDEGEDVWPGTVQLDFPLVAGQFYAIWMYCQFFADDAGTNAFSWSSAFGALHVRVPFLVVEESTT
jgi:hypothetical protein